MTYTFSFLELNMPMLRLIPEQLPCFAISVDESKRPLNAHKLMREYQDLPDDTMGTSGTFIKLNEDEI